MDPFTSGVLFFLHFLSVLPQAQKRQHGNYQDWGYFLTELKKLKAKGNTVWSGLC